MLSYASLGVIKSGEDFAVYLPYKMFIPLIETADDFKWSEHELLEWCELYLLNKETFTEVCTT